jgi:16S rRNA (cytosine1402-N4)-methyltransferase
MSNERYHEPVLLDECITGLNVNPDGVYVDCTFGGGGHSRALLARLSANGRLIAFDRDQDAERNSIPDPRFTFVHANFENLESFLRSYDAIPVDGIMADLGVSSYHLDTPARGFSTRSDAPLDMRMDRGSHLTADRVINTYPEESLAQIIMEYGELPGRRIARAIVQSRPLHTTGDLRNVVAPFAGRLKEKFLAKVFQAIRIEVNSELVALKALLEQAARALVPGGRLAVVSYHSLEHRLVKNYMLHGSFSGEETKDVFGNVRRPLRPVTRKPIRPTEAELHRNPRARSAHLRIAEKL